MPVAEGGCCGAHDLRESKSAVQVKLLLETPADDIQAFQRSPWQFMVKRVLAGICQDSTGRRQG